MKASQFFPIAGMLWLLSSCCSSRSYLRPQSDLPKISCSTRSMYDLADKVRAKLIEGCPIGTTRLQTQAYIKSNFDESQGWTHDGSLYYKINRQSIYPIGENWLEVSFEFDRQQRLRNISVKNKGDAWYNA